MEAQMTSELNWLVLTVLMTGLFWVPYIVSRLIEHGIFTGIWDPLGLTHTKYEWVKRQITAHDNAIENLAVFAPLVLALHVTGSSTAATGTACAIYFFARALHYIAFTFAIPAVRVITFLVGVGCQVTIALTLLDIM